MRLTSGTRSLITKMQQVFFGQYSDELVRATAHATGLGENHNKNAVRRKVTETAVIDPSVQSCQTFAIAQANDGRRHAGVATFRPTQC